MKRNLTCIICPRGCSLSAQCTEEKWNVTGQGCTRGVRYAMDECTHPVRTITTVVAVKNRRNTMLSVKTTSPIPKERIQDALSAIHAIAVNAPIQIGTVLLHDLYGADIVATKQID